MAVIMKRTFFGVSENPCNVILSVSLPSSWTYELRLVTKGNQCTMWLLSSSHGFSPQVMAPRQKVHRRKLTCICISRREIKSRITLLQRRHFKLWEHSWMSKVNYTISQMFRELLPFFFCFAWRKTFSS